jgi:hypothetical protein
VKISQKTNRLTAVCLSNEVFFSLKKLAFVLFQFTLLFIFLLPLTPINTFQTAKASNGSYFHNVTPGRLYDSRPGSSGIFTGAGAISSGQTRTTQASGYLGVPSGATAIVANLTVANAVSGGNLKAFSASISGVNTASINWYSSGARVLANSAIIELDSAGQFKVQHGGGGATDFIIDIFGYLDDNVTGGIYNYLSSSNSRLYDTRPGCCAQGQGSGVLLLGASRNISVRGQLGIPNSSTVTAVVVNLQAVDSSSGGGNFRLYPTGSAIPNVSNVNWFTTANPSYPNVARTVGNLAIVPIGSNGQISLYSDSGAPGNAHAVIDVMGYIVADSARVPAPGPSYILTNPQRLYDSRPSEPNYPGSSVKGNLAPGSTRQITGRGLAGVPPNAINVLLRITTVDVTGGGFLAMYTSTYPFNSSVNTTGASQVIGNMAIVSLDGNGQFTVRAENSSMGFIIDVFGYTISPVSTNALAQLLAFSTITNPPRYRDAESTTTTMDPTIGDGSWVAAPTGLSNYQGGEPIMEIGPYKFCENGICRSTVFVSYWDPNSQTYRSERFDFLNLLPGGTYGYKVKYVAANTWEAVFCGSFCQTLKLRDMGTSNIFKYVASGAESSPDSTPFGTLTISENKYKDVDGTVGYWCFQSVANTTTNGTISPNPCALASWTISRP